MKNEVDVVVGSRLKLARTAKGMSQTKLGEMTGVTFQQIQKYEKGANRISASRLHQFAIILDLPESYFFEPLYSLNNEEPAIEVEDKRIFKIIRGFNKMPDEGKRIFYDMSKVIANSKGEEE